MPKMQKMKMQKKQPKPVEKKSRSPKQLFSLRGMKDILPKDSFYWTSVFSKLLTNTSYFGFDFMLPPVLEEAPLFIRSVGKGTDIVDKEMYVFEDKDTTKVALRPEFTAGMCRAFIQNGMHNLPQPVKVWSWGSLFRHEKPQAGRYREHRQIDVEVFGSALPVIDAEVILLAYTLLTDFGIQVEVRLNSIGTPEDRTRYKMELVSYYKTKRGYLCDDCKKRLVKNPMRLLDCKKEQCQPIKDDAPQILDWLSDSSKSHFMKVLEYLDKLNVPYVLDSTLVRGLDYYTHTLFEIYRSGEVKKPEPVVVAPQEENTVEMPAESGENAEVVVPQEEVETPEEAQSLAQSALCGGGRYDLLIEQLGGNPTPSVGFGMGIERVVAELKANGVQPEKENKPKIFLAQLGEQASEGALKIMNDLRKAGIKVAYNFGKTALRAQLELANKLGVVWTIILGQKEVVDGTVIIRDMESGNQEIIDESKLEAWLKREMSTVATVKKIKKDRK